jgi:hypothetical protein
VATISSWLPEDAVFDFTLSNPSAVDTSYLVLTNGTAGSADYTTTDSVMFLGCNYWNVWYNNCGYIDEVLYIANGTVSATGTIIDNNNAPTVATITPASATEGSDVVFDF